MSSSSSTAAASTSSPSSSSLSSQSSSSWSSASSSSSSSSSSASSSSTSSASSSSSSTSTPMPAISSGREATSLNTPPYVADPHSSAPGGYITHPSSSSLSASDPKNSPPLKIPSPSDQSPSSDPLNSPTPFPNSSSSTTSPANPPTPASDQPSSSRQQPRAKAIIKDFIPDNFRSAVVASLGMLFIGLWKAKVKLRSLSLFLGVGMLFATPFMPIMQRTGRAIRRRDLESLRPFLVAFVQAGGELLEVEARMQVVDMAAEFCESRMGVSSAKFRTVVNFLGLYGVALLTADKKRGRKDSPDNKEG